MFIQIIFYSWPVAVEVLPAPYVAQHVPHAKTPHPPGSCML